MNFKMLQLEHLESKRKYIFIYSSTAVDFILKESAAELELKF